MSSRPQLCCNQSPPPAVLACGQPAWPRSPHRGSSEALSPALSPAPHVHPAARRAQSCRATSPLFRPEPHVPCRFVGSWPVPPASFSRQSLLPVPPACAVSRPRPLAAEQSRRGLWTAAVAPYVSVLLPPRLRLRPGAPPTRRASAAVGCRVCVCLGAAVSMVSQWTEMLTGPLKVSALPSLVSASAEEPPHAARKELVEAPRLQDPLQGGRGVAREKRVFCPRRRWPHAG